MVDTMAEPAAAVPELLRPEQAAQKYEEAVAVAVEKCAADTAGQRCYICLETVHPDTNEGLVRGCACRGGAGIAHVSCLARGAQVAVERDAKMGWLRWCMCGLCKQKYHGVVKCALAWACWKTYVGRPEDGWGIAMMMLGSGLFHAEKYEDALSVFEAELAMKRRVGGREGEILTAQSNLASTYEKLGRLDEASQMYREVYSRNLSSMAKNIREPSERPSTMRRPLFHSSASKKPSRCCANRSPWRDAVSARVMNSRSG